MPRATAVVCFFLMLAKGSGQMAPAPSSASVTGTSQLGFFLSPLDTEVISPISLSKWGPVRLKPHFFYRFSYGDGLQAQPGQSSKTAINEISPGVLFELSEHWTLDYTPVIRFYSNDRFRDGTDHSVTLIGATTYRDWSLGLSQRFALSSEPLVETGGQTLQETYSTAINGAYQINEKLSLELGGNQNFRFLDQASAGGQPLTDSREWSTLDWVNYQFLPKAGFALGAGFGYNDLALGSDTTDEQLQARLNLGIGQKLTLSFNGGFEIRQFLDSSQPDLLNPIFGLSLQYQIFEVTGISLSANRTVSSSFFQNQVTENTGFDLSLRQRLLGKFYLDLNGGYGVTSYQSSSTALKVNREDRLTRYSVRLSRSFFKHANAAVFYNVSENSSRESSFNYSSSQVGFELGYRF